MTDIFSYFLGLRSLNSFKYDTCKSYKMQFWFRYKISNEKGLLSWNSQVCLFSLLRRFYIIILGTEKDLIVQICIFRLCRRRTDEHVRNQHVNKITQSSWKCSMVREMFLLNVLHEQDEQRAAAKGQAPLLCQDRPGSRQGRGYYTGLALPTSYPRREEPCPVGPHGSVATVVLISHLPFRPPGTHS